MGKVESGERVWRGREGEGEGNVRGGGGRGEGEGEGMSRMKILCRRRRCGAMEEK